MEAAAKKDQEARATAAVAKLERLKAGWKENQALQAAAAAGDSGAVGKKKVQCRLLNIKSNTAGEAAGCRHGIWCSHPMSAVGLPRALEVALRC